MSDRFVTVASFQDPVEATLAKNLLEDQGIPGILLDETTVATDWLLSGAIGGVKLQVAPLHVERAELLLAQANDSRDQDDDEAPAVETAIAAREIAEDLQAEREDKAEINKLADKLFRSAVFGLVFWPLQLYTLYLLLAILVSEGKVSPKRRWKVWASIVLNMPIMAVVILPVALVINGWTWETGSPDKPVWQRRRISDIGFSVNMPHEPLFSEGRLGDSKVFTWTAHAESRAYRVTYMPGAVARERDPVMPTLKDFVIGRVGPEGVLRKDEPIEPSELPGRECIIQYPNLHERTRMFVRGDSLFLVSAFGTAADVASDEAERFFKSLRLK